MNDVPPLCPSVRPHVLIVGVANQARQKRKGIMFVRLLTLSPPLPKRGGTAASGAGGGAATDRVTLIVRIE